MQRRRAISLFWMIAAACCAASPSLVFAQGRLPTGKLVPTDAETLVGVSETHVLVEETLIADLPAEAIRASLELQLRKNGVPVSKTDKCYLWVQVTALHDLKEPTSACSIVVQFRQQVTLPNGNRCFASTWNRAFVGKYGDRVIAVEVKRILSDFVDIFSNDWLEANP